MAKKIKGFTCIIRNGATYWYAGWVVSECTVGKVTRVIR